MSTNSILDNYVKGSYSEVPLSRNFPTPIESLDELCARIKTFVQSIFIGGLKGRFLCIFPLTQKEYGEKVEIILSPKTSDQSQVQEYHENHVFKKFPIAKPEVRRQFFPSSYKHSEKTNELDLSYTIYVKIPHKNQNLETSVLENIKGIIDYSFTMATVNQTKNKNSSLIRRLLTKSKICNTEDSA